MNSGDLDMVVPHIATEKWIESLNLTVVEDWKPWFVDDQVAGLVHLPFFFSKYIS